MLIKNFKLIHRTLTGLSIKVLPYKITIPNIAILNGEAIVIG